MSQKNQLENNPTAMPDLDLSKVANMEAFKRDDKETAANITKTLNVNARKTAKKKFNFVEPVQFPLPSRGIHYQDSEDPDLRRGLVNLTPMSLADEEILTNKAYLKNGSTFRVLYDTCMCNDYPAKRILSYDATYMMYVLRSITYGDSYKFKITCEDCDKSFEHEMNISDIEWKEMDANTPDERVIKLPNTGFTVVMPLSRLETEESLEKLKKLHANNPLATETVLTFVNKTTSIQYPNGDEVDPADWIDFYHELPGGDKAAINDAFKDAVNQPEITVVCPHCGNVITMPVPITADFFRLG